MRTLGTRAHHHDHSLGLGVPDVVEEPVVTAGQRGEAFHGFGDHVRAPVVEQVRGLPTLEEGVGVLRRAACHRPIRVERAVPMCRDGFGVDQGGQHLVVDACDLLDLMRRAEAVEEVQERDTRGQRGRMADGSEILCLLR